jgi:hypothetical protein
MPSAARKSATSANAASSVVLKRAALDHFRDRRDVSERKILKDQVMLSADGTSEAERKRNGGAEYAKVLTVFGPNRAFPASGRRLHYPRSSATRTAESRRRGRGAAARRAPAPRCNPSSAEEDYFTDEPISTTNVEMSDDTTAIATNIARRSPVAARRVFAARIKDRCERTTTGSSRACI